VDAVIDEERGPLVMEVNARPGLEIQNVAGVGLANLISGDH
jgi:glutathione synthase/RimK-type ligase-like ATP-grasp enzyme